MSTRATYRFVAPHGFDVMFYIHHDGYPKGAAQYILNAFQAGVGGALVDRFHRLNDNCELTASHEVHGDTEYRYTFSNSLELGEFGEVKCEARYGWETARWDVVFRGSIVEFVQKYAAGELHALDTGWTRKRVVTVAQLRAELDEARAKLAAYVAKFPTHSGNISAMESDVARAERALASVTVPA
jgi:hypothetical protein